MTPAQLSAQVAALREADKERTQGTWTCDRDESEEAHGLYYAYRLHAEDLPRGRDVLADSINSTASILYEESDEDGTHRWDETARRNFTFIALSANLAIPLADRCAALEAALRNAIDDLVAASRERWCEWEVTEEELVGEYRAALGDTP